MKNFCKYIFLKLELLTQSISSILSIILFSKHSKYGLSYLNNKLKIFDTCCILGTGPSLKSDIKYINNRNNNIILITVNNFCNDDLFYKIKPQVHLIIDPNYFRIGKGESIKKEQEVFIEKMNKIDWEIYLITPMEFKKSAINKLIININIHFIYINTIPIEGIKIISHFLYRLNFGMPTPQNVLIAAVFCAINCNFHKIYLFGAEHSWAKDVFVYENNKVCYVENHFYEEKDKLREMEGFTISSFYTAISKTFKSHQLLRNYANSKNIDIINCTKGSFIDAYNRGEYNYE